MKKIFLFLLLFILGTIGSIIPPLFADSLDDELDHDIAVLTGKNWNRIELQDGTVVKGRISGPDSDGFDWIETEDEGSFEVDDREIYSVEDWEASKPLLTDEEINDPKMKAFLEHYNSVFLSDPMVGFRFSRAVDGDPDLVGVFGESEFVKVLANYYDHHDIAEFKKYSKSAQLLAHPEAMTIIEKFTRKEPKPYTALSQAEMHEPKMQAFMKNYASRLEQDPQMLKKIRAALDLDPKLKDIFNDPAFMKDLADYFDHHDITEIRKHPLSKNILGNSQLMSLIELITTKS